MATAASLAGTNVPDSRDSISFVPTLTNTGEPQSNHEFLYWEFHEGGFSQAALYQGRWKGIRLRDPSGPVAIYDLENDPTESRDCTTEHPELASKLTNYLANARSDSPDWPPKPPSPINKPIRPKPQHQ
jgi:arylsulfatase A-like enzyme